MKKYAEFEQKKSKCRDCPIGLEYNQVVLSDGNKMDPKVLVIGEACGATELEQNKPFIGKCGKFLRKEMQEAGFIDEDKNRRADYLITNTIPCRPKDNKFPKDYQIVERCVKKWLLREIEIVQPTIILCIGSKSLKFLTGKEPITEHRGKVFDCKIGDKLYNVIATYHPSYVQRKIYGKNGPQIYGEFKSDLKLAINLANEIETDGILRSFGIEDNNEI